MGECFRGFLANTGIGGFADSLQQRRPEFRSRHAVVPKGSPRRDVASKPRLINSAVARILE
jgi:hypothetical protein